LLSEASAAAFPQHGSWMQIRNPLDKSQKLQSKTEGRPACARPVRPNAHGPSSLPKEQLCGSCALDNDSCHLLS
jgi:hypothetical protein